MFTLLKPSPTSGLETEIEEEELEIVEHLKELLPLNLNLSPNITQAKPDSQRKSVPTVRRWVELECWELSKRDRADIAKVDAFNLVEHEEEQEGDEDVTTEEED